MSPSIFKSKSNIEQKTNSENFKEIKNNLAERQKFIEKNFDYVGENFAYNARIIHYKNKKNQKGIYGLATKEEHKELKEEGIEVETIPWIKNRNN